MKFTFLAVVCFVFGLHLVACDNAEAEKKCNEIAHEAAEIDKGINVTNRFLRPPVEYKKVADKCQETIDCATKVDPKAAAEMAGDFAMCNFYIYYNRNFASCAEKLIAKKDDKIHCLDILFNDYYEPDVDECIQWDSLQACIKAEIERNCEDQKVEDWVKNAVLFRKAMCENNKDD